MIPISTHATDIRYHLYRSSIHSLTCTQRLAFLHATSQSNRSSMWWETKQALRRTHLWLVITIVRPMSRAARMTCHSFLFAPASRPWMSEKKQHIDLLLCHLIFRGLTVVGSSRKTRSGLPMNAKTELTLRLLPPLGIEYIHSCADHHRDESVKYLSLLTFRLLYSSRPNRSIMSWQIWLVSLHFKPFNLSIMARSETVQLHATSLIPSKQGNCFTDSQIGNQPIKLRAKANINIAFLPNEMNDINGVE